jgi:hypothetical protein
MPIESKKGVKTMLIDIVIEMQFEKAVLGCSIIHKVSYVQEDGSIKYDADALAEYEDFCSAFETEIDRYIELIDFKTSSISETSRYYYLYPVDESGNPIKTVVVEIRMSDHELPSYHKSRTDKMRKEKLSNIAGYDEVSYRFRNFVVNGNKYTNYDSALRDVVNKVKSIINKESKRQGRK